MPSIRPQARSLLVLALASSIPAADAAPDPAVAEHVFAEARRLCEAEADALWGRSLCGPVMLVDPADAGVVASHADAGGVLVRLGAVYTGTLPADAVMSNTAMEWSGTRWTQLLWPVPQDPNMLRTPLVHELFHRIQPELGLDRGEAGNRHLDTFQGRYLLQLEWRALARALMAEDPAQRRDHVASALAFRAERRRLFPEAAHGETALEINEGLAEYTGVRAGLAFAEQRRAHGVYSLAAFMEAPGFVRSFAYASGPAYGLLLDEADPAWRGKLDADTDLGRMLAAALRLDPDAATGLAARERRYDPDGEVLAAEQARERQRQERLAGWRRSLLEGPVLVLPLQSTRFQMNPQTVAALDDVGTVYPELRLGDRWGELVVDGGAALVHADRKRAVVALPAGSDGLRGEGWTLSLKPGWKLVPGEREGDLTLAGPAP